MVKGIFALFLITASAISAQPKIESVFYHNGNALLDYCESENATERVACMAYLAGTIDSTEAWVASNQLRRAICKPKPVTTKQLRKVFIEYANTNPEGLHLAASSIAIAAFAEAFPCQ